MTRKVVSSFNASDSPEPPPSEVIIATQGDVLLEVKDPRTGLDQRYRCSRAVLRSSSEYFNVLLDPIKFSEGIAIEAKIRQLVKQYTDCASIPTSKLPAVTVSDVGQLPKACLSASTVIRLFFRILHDAATPWPISRLHAINLVALLAIVADRLAAIRPIRAYLRSQKFETTLLRDRRTCTAHQLEIDNRQRLLAGIIFGFPTWVRECSAALILAGPKRQVTAYLESGDDEEAEDDALWWRLPNGLEEELACRRDYALDTLSSLQKHFIDIYIKKPQCRLGYGSSPQCDSFQLGEIIRFLTRKGTIAMESTITPTLEDPEPFNGSIYDILSQLRTCPSYQLESHAHCGLRSRLLPILDGLGIRRVAMCLECWKRDRAQESWLENPTQGDWEFKKEKMVVGCEEHMRAKSMFTASHRDWTPPVHIG